MDKKPLAFARQTLQPQASPQNFNFAQITPKHLQRTKQISSISRPQPTSLIGNVNQKDSFFENSLNGQKDFKIRQEDRLKLLLKSNKSEGNLIFCSGNKQTHMPQSTINQKEISAQSSTKTLNQGKYFQRKKDTGLRLAHPLQFNPVTTQSNKKADQIYQQSSFLKIKESSTHVQQLLKMKQLQIQKLTELLQKSKQQNCILAQTISQNSFEIFQLQQELAQIRSKNDSLNRQLQQNIGNIHNLETYLGTQVQRLQNNILDLKQTVNYLHMENTVLKNVKTQCAVQKKMVVQLEKQKKMLEQKIRLIYEHIRKQKSISENSQISLNFSLQDQGNLKTMRLSRDSFQQKTPQRQRNMSSSAFLYKQKINTCITRR